MNAETRLAIGQRGRGATADRHAVNDPVMRLDDPRAIQILATEHWSLLATRTLSWNESFSRTSMLLATLSATVIAIALAAQVADFGLGSRPARRPGPTIVARSLRSTARARATRVGTSILLKMLRRCVSTVF